MKLRDLTSVVVIFILAGIAYGVGTEVIEDMKVETSTTSTATNETVTITTGTGTVQHDSDGTQITDCINNSVDATAFTIPTQCNLTSSGLATITCDQPGVSSVNVTYKHYDHDETWSAFANTTEGMTEISSWMPTIGLVIASGLIITVIFASFGGKV